MFSDIELEHYLQRRNLPPSARQVVAQVRGSKPSRRVRSGRCNVSGRFASRKMECVIQSESHKNEWAAIVEWEFDNSTYEFYDQPPKIKLAYQNGNGRRVSYLATPDFFVLNDRFTGWVECKTEEWLCERAKEGSTLYVPDGDGRWRCPPGEAYAATFGLQFKVRSSAETNWQAVRNAQFLADYYDDRMPSPTPDDVAAIMRTVAERPWMPLKGLIDADHGIASDVIYRMIADGMLYVALDRDLLSEPEVTPVFRDRVAADAHRLYLASQERPAISERRAVHVAVRQSLVWDGKPWRIVNTGLEDIYLENEERVLSSISRTTFQQLVLDGKIVGASVIPRSNSAAEKIIRAASPTNLEHAMKRHQAIFPPEGAPPTGFCERALRKWRALYRHAVATLGSGFLGLVPAYHRCGNRERKLDAAVIGIMDAVIDGHVLSGRKKTIFSCWGEVVVQCEEQALPPPSEEAFRQQIRRRDPHAVKQAREGEKAAYDLEEFHWLYRTTPRHGERPFEIGHIDHTQVDIQLVGRRRGEKLRKPWLTLLLDAHTRKVLAWAISPDKPSYRSCMAVIRDCVRRHGRVPKTFVVDGGSEFASVYFETLTAYLDCNKKTRPASKSRFGSVIERVFGVANKQFIHNLEGNNQALQKPRSMSKSHDPRRRATWTLDTFRTAFDGYVERVYHSVEHPALSLSPNQAMANGLLLSGTRAHTLIPYGPEFLVMCLPTTPKGTATVVPGRGVKIHYDYFWTPHFRSPLHARKNVPVRYDPEDKSIALAWLDGHWEICQSDFAADFQGRTEKEIEMASHEIRARHARNGERKPVTARDLALYMREIAITEAELAVAQDAAAPASVPPLPCAQPDTASIWDNLTLKIFGDFE